MNFPKKDFREDIKSRCSCCGSTGDIHNQWCDTEKPIGIKERILNITKR